MNVKGAKEAYEGLAYKVLEDATPIEHRDVIRNNLEKQRVQIEDGSTGNANANLEGRRQNRPR